MEVREHMTIVPHDYQLKGATQTDWGARSPLRGLMNGDPMGMGKTLQAILAMYKVKDEGICLVICPSGLCKK